MPGFRAAIREVNSSMKDVGKSAQQMASGAGTASAGMSTLASVGLTAVMIAAQVALTGILALASGMALVGSTGIKMNSNLEQTQIRLETLTGLGKETLDWVRELSIRTPFTTETLSQALAMARAYGFQTSQAKQYLVVLGDADAALAGHGQVLEAATRALGQMNTATRVNAQDMRQLTEAGIPAWQILADKMGLSTAEVRKMSEEGKLFASEVVPLLVAGIEEKFGGAMADQARTMQGLFDTLREGLQLASADITLPAFDFLKEALIGITDEITQPGTGFRALILETTDLMREVFADWDAQDVVEGFREIVSGAREAVFAIRELRYALRGMSGADVMLGAVVQVERNNAALVDSLDRMKTAHETTVEALNEQITDAGDATERALSDIADKHAEKTANIQNQMGKLASQFNDQMEKLDRDLNRKLADNEQDLFDKLESMAESHADKKASIEQSLSDENFSHEERIASLRDSLEERVADTHERFADKRETLNDQLAEAQTAAQRREIRERLAELDAEEQAEITKLQTRERADEERAQRRHDREIAMLQKRLADEETEYNRNVEKEKERSADKKARIQEDNVIAVDELKKRIGQEMGELAAQQAKLDEQRATEEQDVKDSYDRQVQALEKAVVDEVDDYTKGQEEIRRQNDITNQQIVGNAQKMADDLEKGPIAKVRSMLRTMVTIPAVLHALIQADWSNAGVDMVTGISAGIQAEIPNLVSTALGAVGQAYSAVQDFLGSHSPSKLYEGLGFSTQQGMAQGIARGAGMPAAAAMRSVAGMTSVVAASTAVPVITPAPNVVVQGGSTTIDRRINVNANYAKTQSPARIMDDLQLATMLQG